MLGLVFFISMVILVVVTERASTRRANARAELQMTPQGAIHRQQQLGLKIARRAPLVWLTKPVKGAAAGAVA